MAPVRPLPGWELDRTASELFPEVSIPSAPGRRGVRWALLGGGVVPLQLRYLTFLPLVLLFLVVMHLQDSRSPSAQLSKSMQATLDSARSRQAQLDVQRAGAKQLAALGEGGEPAGSGGTPGQSPRARQLRLMTYNVWNFDDGPEWEAVRLPAIADAIRLARPALVGLQELRIRGERDQGKQLQAKLSEMGLRYHLEYVRGMQYGETEEGIGVLSRFPILRLEVRDLPLGYGDDQNTRRCMMVEVEVPQYGRVQFFNTHLSYNTGQQVWNAVEALKFADEFGFGGPQFIVGDLNTPPGEVAPVALLTHNRTWLAEHPLPPPARRWPAIDWAALQRAPPFVDAWGVQEPGSTLGGPCDAASCTFSNTKPKTRCDYILYRGPVSALQSAVAGTAAPDASGTPPSDHRAVVSTVRLEVPPP